MFQPTSYGRGIINSSLLNVLSKGLVFFVNLIIASTFGASISTDIYFFCFSCIILVVVFISGIINGVLIPEYIHIESTEKDGLSSSTSLINRAFYFTILVLLIIAAICIISPIRFFEIISNFSNQDLNQERALIALAVPVLVLQGIAAFLNDILVSKKYFTLPMFVALANSILILSLVTLIGREIGIKSIFIANIIAYLASLSFQLYLFRTSLKWNFFKVKGVTKSLVVHNAILVGFGWLATSVSSFIPIYLLSRYSEGVITALSLGQRIAEVPIAIFVMHIANILSIKFSELIASQKQGEINDIFFRSSKILLIVLVPGSVLTSLFSFEITSLLFGWGAMSLEALRETSSFLEIIILATPFYGMNILVSKLFIATKKIRIAFIYQIFANVVFISIIYFLVQMLGSMGFAWAYLIFYVFNGLFILIVARINFVFLNFKIVIKYEFLIIVLNLALVGFLHFLSFYFFGLKMIGIFILLYLVLHFLLIGLFDKDVIADLRSIVRK